jgi:beta-D-galactosyl-(1->4)-L-rhamnose phosphorylase
MKKPSLSHGGFTLPSQAGMDKETLELARKWGADAIRDSDGTELSADLLDLGLDVYSTLCLIRMDQEWAKANPMELQQMYLVSARATALSTGQLQINLLEQYFDQQFRINWDADPKRYWEVVDRTTGKVMPVSAWETDPVSGAVIVREPVLGHEYTASFLAYQIWETTSMYNHLTNNWGDRPHQMPVDPRQPRTRAHLTQLLHDWIKKHPRTDIVRFTSIAYQFTVMRAASGKRLYRDWAGYHGTVSPLALDAFEAKFGYKLRPEVFVEDGLRAHTDCVPSKAYLDWIGFTHDFLMDLCREWIDIVHAAGKKAYFFFCDHYIGTEPYRPRFKELGFDGIISPAIDGAESRKNADCPGNMVKELRLYPYFFPTEGDRPVFSEGGDPVADCRKRWVHVRRALLRNCVDRIGYGGYLDLVMRYPDFLDEVEKVTREFRFIKHHGGMTKPYCHGIKVGVLGAWGASRAWHSEGACDFGALEILSGLPFEVVFLSFEELREGVPDDVKVLLNYGPAGSSWSGGDWWKDPRVVANIRNFVFLGGGLVGLHEPSAVEFAGRSFQLSDLFGVEKNNVLRMNVENFNRPEVVDDHYITRGLDMEGALGSLADRSDVSVTDAKTQLLAGAWNRVGIAVRHPGAGRSVFIARTPYSPDHCTLLKQAIQWAGGLESNGTAVAWDTLAPGIESAYYPETGRCLVINNRDQSCRFALRDGCGKDHFIDLEPGQLRGFAVEHDGGLGVEV